MSKEKVWAKFVPHTLTGEQKQAHENHSRVTVAAAKMFQTSWKQLLQVMRHGAFNDPITNGQSADGWQKIPKKKTWKSSSKIKEDNAYQNHW